MVIEMFYAISFALVVLGLSMLFFIMAYVNADKDLRSNYDD